MVNVPDELCDLTTIRHKIEMLVLKCFNCVCCITEDIEYPLGVLMSSGFGACLPST
jgi:hypothetical protein